MKIHYSLILLDSPILVSDEEYKTNDQVWDIKDGVQRTVLKPLKDEWCFKIIAGIPELPSVELPDEVEQVLEEKYGWVDVEKLAKIHSDKYGEINKHERIPSFIEGFKLAQSLNKKRFSEDDMKKAMGLYLERVSTFQDRTFERCQDAIILKLKEATPLIPVEVEIEDYVEEETGTELKWVNKRFKVTKVL